MGLGGFFKGLGKVALKAAPFAAMAIPGVGPLAGALMQGGLGALDAKVSGGGLKDVLMGAGMGAATSGLTGAGKGLAPSKGFLGTLKGIGGDILKSPAAMGGIAGAVAGSRTAKPKEDEKKRQPPIGPSGRARPAMDIRTPNLAHPLLQGINQGRASQGLPAVDPSDYLNYSW